jgi:AbrB family looped-hinge helix DNA binding protein
MNYHISLLVIQYFVLEVLHMRSTITSRGQTVIPAEIRRKYQLSPSDRLEWIMEGNTLRVVPVKENPINAFRGMGKGGSVKRLLAERKKDQAHE